MVESLEFVGGPLDGTTHDVPRGTMDLEWVIDDDADVQCGKHSPRARADFAPPRRIRYVRGYAGYSPLMLYSRRD